MEDDETFDAGRGSFLNRDGQVQLDALIMDGATLRAGGVGCVERLRNPVARPHAKISATVAVYLWVKARKNSPPNTAFRFATTKS